MLYQAWYISQSGVSGFKMHPSISGTLWSGAPLAGSCIAAHQFARPHLVSRCMCNGMVKGFPRDLRQIARRNFAARIGLAAMSFVSQPTLAGTKVSYYPLLQSHVIMYIVHKLASIPSWPGGPQASTLTSEKITLRLWTSSQATMISSASLSRCSRPRKLYLCPRHPALCTPLLADTLFQTFGFALNRN